MNTVEDMWQQKEAVIPDAFHCGALKCDLESPTGTIGAGIWLEIPNQRAKQSNAHWPE